MSLEMTYILKQGVYCFDRNGRIVKSNEGCLVALKDRVRFPSAGQEEKVTRKGQNSF